MVAERVGLMATPAVQIVFHVDRVLAPQRARMPAAMAAVATEYANQVKRLMRDSPATGRTYRRGKRVVHRASAPGEPPAPDTGDLLRHVVWRVRQDGDRWLAEVGSTLKYALYLEYGAARGVRSARTGKITTAVWVLYPRPAWEPALLQVRPRIPEILKKYSGRT